MWRWRVSVEVEGEDVLYSPGPPRTLYSAHMHLTLIAIITCT